MYTCFICRYHEIATKGDNRRMFEEKLIDNLRYQCQTLEELPGLTFPRVRGRIYVRREDKAAFTEEQVEIGKENFFQGDKPVATVGENAALNAALAHAGMENSKLIRCKCKSDWVDGTVIYDLYFTDGKRSGTYVLNARTGEILKYKVIEERHDRSVADAVIGEAQAKQIALAKDGLVDGNVSKYEMHLKKVDDSYVYDLNYICNGVRYIVQVAADDGEILSYEKIVLKEGGAPSAETDKHNSAEG